MSCRQEVDFIAYYLSASLNARERAAFESHLDACSDCRAFIDTYKKTVEVTRTFLRARGQANRPPQLFLRRSDHSLRR